MIDLHVHTSMSDGKMSPEDIVHLAARTGLQAIAITDHDTVAGIAPAQNEARIQNLEVIPGVEISVQSAKGTLHILGYFINPKKPMLLNTLEYLRLKRLELIPKIISKLSEHDVHITFEDVMRLAIGGVPGKLHIARAMVNRGYVRTEQDAFDQYLKQDGPAYVEKVKLSSLEAIKLIRDAGGLPVLAHPYSLKQDRVQLGKTLRGLIAEGLQGIEAYYPLHTSQQTQMFLELASKFDLVVSGGTDFHGSSDEPEMQLGVIPGAGPLSYSLLDEMKRRAEVC